MKQAVRSIIAGLALAGLSCAPGGGWRSPEGTAVYRFQTADYEVEYDGTQKKTTIGPGLVRMSRHPEDIVISEGTLRVGGRDYGAVEKKDRVSVVAGKVVVNGQVRPRPAS
jgi:hypothetical protein